jgi:hypothetical protein
MSDRTKSAIKCAAETLLLFLVGVAIGAVVVGL